MVIGQKTMFVRTAGCDYSCSWCDSSFTWDGTGQNEIKQMDAMQIWDELKADLVEIDSHLSRFLEEILLCLKI